MSADPELPKPPVAQIKPTDVSVHADKRIDNYFWLQKRENREVIEYLEAENAYTSAMMAHTEAFQKKLYDELLGRIKETDVDVPTKRGDFFYYTRTEKGKQYPSYCRKLGSMLAEEELLLDQNALAEGKKYCQLGAFRVSPSHRLLAYSVDETGSEVYTTYVKDLETGELLPDKIENCYYALEWANDNETFFYNTLDEAKRPFKLFRHRLGANPAQDALIFTEENEAYFLWLSKTRSKKYLLMELGSKLTSECWVLDADKPESDFQLIHPRQPGMEYSIEHHEDTFYITTNAEAINFKVMQTKVTEAGKKNWQEFLPHRESVKVDGVDAFKDHLVIYERKEGLEQIRICDLRRSEFHYIAFDEAAYSLGGGANPEFDSNQLRFSYSSLVTPFSVFDYDMSKRTLELKKQKEVLGGYNQSDYVVERLSAAAKDGVKVPISLVYKKGFLKDGTGPLYLYGYGSYGSTIDPSFSSNRLSLLDRGMAFAIAHVRGGGVMGRPWYENGKFLHKKNTFEDFITCAEHLIAQNYTNSQKLVICGGSAGGMLVGAVANMRPELFHIVVAKVPFVDVLNTMLDASIPLTALEYEEWGNPQDPEFYNYMRTYSPYDNVAAKAYPNILITAGLNDPRVQYWEPAKWTAKLRALKTDDNLLLLKTNMGAGHSGASGRYDYLTEVAFEYAFVLDRLAILE